MALASVPKASLSLPRGCWTRRGSALNIGRSVRGSSSTRRTRKWMSAHRSHHHPRNVARTRWRARLGRVVNHWRREKIIQSALLLRSSPGNHSSISIGTPLSSQSFINVESESPFSLLCFVRGGFFFGYLGESRTTCARWCSQQCGLRPRRSEKKGKQRLQLPPPTHLPTKPDNLQKRPPLSNPTRRTHHRPRAQRRATTTIGQRSSRQCPAPRRAV